MAEDPVRTTGDAARSRLLTRGVPLGAAVLVFCAWWALVTAPAPGFVAGPLEHEAYVWQRDWTRVPSALGALPEDIVGVAWLGAEVETRSARRGGAARVDVPWEEASLRAMRASRRTLVLRVGPVPGALARADAVRRALHAALAAQQARASGLWEEVQIDFDAAESQLADYAVWLRGLRDTLRPGARLTVTALPAWLDQAAFRDVVGAVDGFVLQVHGLAAPKHIDEPVTICDPILARRAVRIAARFGSPFRVALPTYGYGLAFDGAGSFIGLRAEGEDPAWPAGTQRVRVMADAEAMADLVAHWEARRPRHLVGVIWYRLPLPGDRWVWSQAAFDAVRRGEAPDASRELRLRVEGPQRTAVLLAATGSRAVTWPAAIWLEVPQGIERAEGLAGYRFERVSPTTGWLRWQDEASLPLAPGREQDIAWMRHPAGAKPQATWEEDRR